MELCSEDYIKGLLEIYIARFCFTCSSTSFFTSLNVSFLQILKYLRMSFFSDYRMCLFCLRFFTQKMNETFKRSPVVSTHTHVSKVTCFSRLNVGCWLDADVVSPPRLFHSIAISAWSF